MSSGRSFKSHGDPAENVQPPVGGFTQHQNLLNSSSVFLIVQPGKLDSRPGSNIYFQKASRIAQGEVESREEWPLRDSPRRC